MPNQYCPVEGAIETGDPGHPEKGRVEVGGKWGKNGKVTRAAQREMYPHPPEQEESGCTGSGS